MSNADRIEASNKFRAAHGLAPKDAATRLTETNRLRARHEIAPVVEGPAPADVVVKGAGAGQTQGKCSCCKVVLVWDVALKVGSITRGEIACPKCSTVLTRTHSRTSEPFVLRVPVRVAA